MKRMAMMLVVSVAAGCATAKTAPMKLGDAREAVFATTGQGRYTFNEAVKAAPFTVLSFFAAGCPIQKAHDARLKGYYAELAPRGVAFFAIDAEADSSLEVDEREARARAYPYAIVSDPKGSLADAFGVEFATETLIVDREGKVRYRGGIDSDAMTVHEDGQQYLRDALVALLAGGAPAQAETKAKGCELRRQ